MARAARRGLAHVAPRPNSGQEKLPFVVACCIWIWTTMTRYSVATSVATARQPPGPRVRSRCDGRRPLVRDGCRANTDRRRSATLAPASRSARLPCDSGPGAPTTARLGRPIRSTGLPGRRRSCLFRALSARGLPPWSVRRLCRSLCACGPVLKTRLKEPGSKSRAPGAPRPTDSDKKRNTTERRGCLTRTEPRLPQSTSADTRSGASPTPADAPEA